MQVEVNGYLISDDAGLIQPDVVKSFLARSYWAGGRSAQRIDQSLERSLCYGVYQDGKQVGFARVVTDYATMYWLCDVFIDETHRGKGLGRALVAAITESDELRGLFGLLGTRDAHSLYEQYGFVREAERFMRRPPATI